MQKCPECGGTLIRCLPNSGFGKEFLQCQECSQTIHELGRPENFVAPAQENDGDIGHLPDLLGPPKVGHKCPSCGEGTLLSGVPSQSFGDEFIRCSRCSYTVHEAGPPPVDSDPPGVYEVLKAGGGERAWKEGWEYTLGMGEKKNPDYSWDRPPPKVERVVFSPQDYLAWVELDDGQTMVGLPHEPGETQVVTGAGEWVGTELLRTLPRGVHIRSTRELEAEVVVKDYRFEVAEVYAKLLRRKHRHRHLLEPLATAAAFVDTTGKSPPPTAFESLIFPGTGRLLPEVQYLVGLVLEIAEVPLFECPQGRLFRLNEIGKSPGAITYVTARQDSDELASLRPSPHELVVLSAFLGPYRLRALNA